ncbi:NGFI-A-binding protein homolog [Pollicipes pollicipes]|uniref:NGFI-A-binding protein homolog n=1 Tax=Pollicipes pollicipes TaxID=41117 RepID=UPI00188531EC|nr:NGFI-A-binding protein homolog [Pollicipes pollicipes]
MPTPSMEPHGESSFPRQQPRLARPTGRHSDEAESPELAPAGVADGMTFLPTNESELQLYRVLQHANLLSYYHIFISQGGDDVQQLCEAGEEEFLEIMALVGMASKPLHVRRLQKALQEWITSPTRDPLRKQDEPPSPTLSQDSGDSAWPRAASAEPSDSPPPPPPVLLDSQVERLAESAVRLAKTLPDFEPRAQNSKRKVCRELEQVMSMEADHPQRLEKFRKYAAIYGRFDCRRRAEKPLTLHEVSVNEAAAHICMQVPALLTRRDELFPLARQAVRHSGYQYSKGHSRSQGAQGFLSREFRVGEEVGGVKRLRLDSDPLAEDLSDGDWLHRQLVVLDGFHNHRALEAVCFAKDHDIQLPTFPPHTAHKLQQLDVSFFKSLKATYNVGIGNRLIYYPG